MSAAMQPVSSRFALALRWVARLSSIASISLIIVFATADPKVPQPQEWLLLALFPIGVVIGMVVGWWRELAGGLIGTASLFAFYAAFLANGYSLNRGVWFGVFALPAMLFLAAGLLQRTSR